MDILGNSLLLSILFVYNMDGCTFCRPLSDRRLLSGFLYKRYL